MPAEAKTRGRCRRACATALAATALAAASLAGSERLDAAAEGSSSSRPPKPNVIVVVADDQDVGLFDRELMPNTFDLLDRGATSLTDFTISTPLCCPSRATQLTGQYAHNSGVTSNDPGYPSLADPANVLPAWLRRAGYKTAHVGRFLNGYRATAARSTDPAPGWDRWIGLTNLHYRDYELSLDGRPRQVHGDGPRRYATRDLHRRAAALLRELIAGQAPFYLQLDELAPHSDRLAGGACRRSALPGPMKLAPVRAVRPDARAVGERNVRDKPAYIRELPPIDRGELARIQRRMRCRAAAVRELDRGIGRIVRLLRRTGALRRTAVIFYSDNGFFNGQHRLAKSKGLPYEEAIQVPFVIRLPPGTRGSDAPARLDIPAANVDIAPTVLELAGAAPCLEQRCRTLDGRSLLDGLEDPASWPSGRAILIELDQRGHPAPGTLACAWEGVRTRGQVYVEYRSVVGRTDRHCRPTEEFEHYRLRGDPAQRRNLWPAAGRRDRRAQRRLQAELEKLRRCAGNEQTPAPGAAPCE